MMERWKRRMSLSAIMACGGELFLGRDMKVRAAFVLLIALAVLPALAQAPQVVRVRGTIQSVDGPVLIIRQGEDPDIRVKLTDDAQIFGVAPATLADVKPGAFIGVGATPQPDGSQKAIQVMIFAESQRGTGEGFRPWDRPNTTMTNGTVDAAVSGVDGQVVTVKYKDGEQRIIIGPDTVIRAYVPSDRAELKPGAHVAILRAERLPDGALQTARVNVGRAGIEP
jgi:hypothetical protein